MDNADTQGLAAALFLLGIYKVTDLIENEMARSSVLHEMIVTAVEQDYLEQRVNGAGVLQTLVAERRATQRAQAEERAAVAERKQAEAEAKLAASQACGRVSLLLQVHPQLRHGGMTHAQTQTPRLMSDQMSVGTQAPSRLEAAAEAPQQQRQQRQQLQELKERA
jgi:hypothetical protein